MHKLLSLLYPDERPVCVICQRPIGVEQAQVASAERRRSGVVSDNRTGNHPQAHTMLDSVCLFCLQDAATSSFEIWTGRMTLSHVSRVSLVCAVTYEGILRDIIRHWKYDGRIEFTVYLAALLANALNQADSFQVAHWDMIVPVPTSPDRWRKRGYHHVGLLAEELSRILGVPQQEVLLRKQSQEFTQSQTVKSAQERRQSLAGQYFLEPRAQDVVQGRNILLVDDVITTGATIGTCTQVLLEAGAKMVVGSGVAHVK